MYRILSPIYGHPEGEITDLTDRSEADIQYYTANGFIEAVEAPTVTEDATVELDTFAEPLMRAVDDAEMDIEGWPPPSNWVTGDTPLTQPDLSTE